MSNLNRDEVGKTLEARNWTFAKTMPKNPHWYVLKEKWGDKALFEFIVQYMRDNARIEYFYRKPFCMFDYNGYKYWTMGNSIETTKLINRARL